MKTVFGTYTLKQQIDFSTIADLIFHNLTENVTFTTKDKYENTITCSQFTLYTPNVADGLVNIIYSPIHTDIRYLVSSVRYSKYVNEEGNSVNGSTWELQQNDVGLIPSPLPDDVWITPTSLDEYPPEIAFFSVITFNDNGVNVSDDFYELLINIADFKNEKAPYNIGFYQEERVSFQPITDVYFVPSLPEPYDNGKLFVGWVDYLNEIPNKFVKEGDSLTSSILLKAVWEDIEEDYRPPSLNYGVIPYSKYFFTWICSPSSFETFIDRCSNPYKAEWGKLGFYSEGEIIKQILVSAKMYPFHASDLRGTLNFEFMTNRVMGYPIGNSVAIVDGWTHIGVNTPNDFPVCVVQVSKPYNDFRDYEPYTTYRLYIPYFGYVDMPCEILYKDTYILRVCIDFISGQGTFYLQGYTTQIRYGSWTCLLGLDIPYTAFGRKDQWDLMKMLSESASAIVGGIGGINTKIGDYAKIDKRTKAYKSGSAFASAAADVAENVVGLGMQIYNIQHEWNARFVYGSNVNDDYSKISMPNVAFILRETAVDIDNLYTNWVGKPLCQTRLLSDLHGYTKIDDIHLDGLSCTEDEKTELLNLLLSGVILP